MIIYPAIDLRHGSCVRLRQGDPNAETVFDDNPAAAALRWQEQGAQWLHVVNLDGALGATRRQIDLLHAAPTIRVQRPGEAEARPAAENTRDALPINLQRLREIRTAVQISIQFGGGLRTLDDIRLAFELGADRVVLGTVALTNPQVVSEALQQWGSARIVVALDARNGKVATHGWQSASRLDIIDAGFQVQALGVKQVLYTDIARDGMLGGVDVETSARLGDVTGLQVIASGGVAGIEDIELLKEYEPYNLDGVIVGQALYTGRLDLAQAIDVARRPLSRRSAGVIPFRTGSGGPEFLLLYNFFFDQWQFPRGTVRQEEQTAEGARREFIKETGLDLLRLFEDRRVTLEYTCLVRSYDIERHIVYYLGEVGPGEATLGNANHCESRWVSAAEAFELLVATSPEQLPALDSALRRLSGATGDD